MDEYLDDGISGTVPMGKRPAGLRLMEDAKDGKFDVVIFYRLGRQRRRQAAWRIQLFRARPAGPDHFQRAGGPGPADSGDAGG